MNEQAMVAGACVITKHMFLLVLLCCLLFVLVNRFSCLIWKMFQDKVSLSLYSCGDSLVETSFLWRGCTNRGY